MIKQKIIKVFLIFVILFTPFLVSLAKNGDILNEEERLWLKSRNNTIVVYPEKSFPPFSYQASSGTPLGLSIDYIELIGENLGIKIEYLPSRALSQILEEAKSGKGDVITSLSHTEEREKYFYFTDNYLNIPTVIVARKDSGKDDITLSNLTGKRVAVGKGYAVEEFLRSNYPRIVLDTVSDDEIGLQQLVLGEVDYAIMDIASLSFYLSKQVLSSVNVVGNVGYSYELSFAVSKDKVILQSILDKGLTQISQNERDILRDKWIITPEENKKTFSAMLKNTLTNDIFQYNFFLFTLFILFFFFKKRDSFENFLNRKAKKEKLENEAEKLSEMSEFLEQELEHIKEAEDKIKKELKSKD